MKTPIPPKIASLFAATILATLLGSTSCVTKPQQNLIRFEYEQPQMGVPFRVVLYAPDSATAEAAAKAAFDRVKQLNAIMSDYEDDSELVRLMETSRPGNPVQVSPELWEVLEQAQRLSARTEGAFDVTAGFYINLWRRARRIHQLPTPERMEQARAITGYGKLRLHPKTRAVEFAVPNMRLDLGGIAKGYAVDQALAVLKQRGLKRAMVAGGGDTAVSDPPPGKKAWRIQLGAFDVPNPPPARFVALRNYALATSGDVFQHVEIDGKRYSHIVDPRTGIGLTDHSQVTIIAPNCATADSLATAVSVLGPAKGLALIEATPGTATLITRKPANDVEQVQSKRFGKFEAKD